MTLARAEIADASAAQAVKQDFPSFRSRYNLEDSHGGIRPVVRSQGRKPFILQRFLATANGGRTISKYRKGKAVYSQGDEADAVFYVMDGKCKVTIVSQRGKEAVVAIHEKGAFFGEGCLNGEPRRVATVRAMTDSEVMRFDKPAIIKALHDEPEFSSAFIAYLLARNARVQADLVDQLFNSSEKRLARLLLLMANFGKDGKPEPVIPAVNQETLADMIGTTRSRVSFFLNKFRKLGFVDYNGNLRVHSSLLAMVLLDDPSIRSNNEPAEWRRR